MLEWVSRLEHNTHEAFVDFLRNNPFCTRLILYTLQLHAIFTLFVCHLNHLKHNHNNNLFSIPLLTTTFSPGSSKMIVERSWHVAQNIAYFDCFKTALCLRLSNLWPLLLPISFKLQPRTKLHETNWKHTRIFLLFLISPLPLLHKYLSSPLPSFNEDHRICMGQHHGQNNIVRGWGGSNLYRSCSVQFRRQYWKTGGSVSRVLSKVVAF